MSGVAGQPAAKTHARQPEAYILGAPRRDAIVAGVAAAVTVAAFVAVADRGVLAHIQRLDNFWLELMVDGRLAPVTAIAKVFNILGLVYVTAPVRLALAAYLALRRRWWHLASFAAAIILSEILIGPLKGAYDRARPPGSLVATTAASFPSGHAVAASVTVLAAAIALVPPGNRRIGWGIAALSFALAMALSRSYLGAHWLSDAIAGLLLGTSCALLAASAADLAQRRWGRQRPSRASNAPEVEVRSASRAVGHE
jgi:membrane-associated phospholipid phosphatase